MAEVIQIKYDDQECFNQNFDANHQSLVIGDNELVASWLLYNTDPDLYLSVLEDFKQTQYEDLKQSVYDQYPSAIAYNFRQSERGEGSADPVRKLLHLKDTWESIIFILYAIVCGEVRKNAIDLTTVDICVGGSLKKFNSSYLMTDALKLKIENIRGIIKYSIANSLNLKCETIEESLLDDLFSLQDIRNDISHHAAPTREQAEEELRTVIPLFEVMLAKTKFLEECAILRFNSLTDRFRCEVYNGHALNKEYENFNFQDIAYVTSLGQEQLFVLWDENIFSLSPFLHFIVDQTGHESYLCPYKYKRSSKYWYEPVKLRTEVCFDTLQERFESEKDKLLNITATN